MNTSQQIFLVFFAIFWGTSANVWPRWKPFHWTLFRRKYPHVRHRIYLSFLLLNIAPLTFFVGVLMALHGGDAPPAATAEYARDLLVGAVPALGHFGFYRIWLGLVERRPSWFYLSTRELRRLGIAGIEPASEALHISTRWWLSNTLWGAAYVIAFGSICFFKTHYPPKKSHAAANQSSRFVGPTITHIHTEMYGKNSPRVGTPPSERIPASPTPTPRCLAYP
jgi:hypothetical protein